MSANRRKIRRGRKILRKPDNIQVGKSINRRFSPASLISIPNDAKISHILIQNDAQFSNEISNEIEAHTVAAPVEEETEQFIPTVFTIRIIIIINTIIIITIINTIIIPLHHHQHLYSSNRSSCSYDPPPILFVHRQGKAPVFHFSNRGSNRYNISMQLTATNTMHAQCNNRTTNPLHKQINTSEQTQGNFYPPEKDVAGPKICQWPVTLKTDYDREANLGLVLRSSLSSSSSKSYLCSMKSKY